MRFLSPIPDPCGDPAGPQQDGAPHHGVQGQPGDSHEGPQGHADQSPQGWGLTDPCGERWGGAVVPLDEGLAGGIRHEILVAKRPQQDDLRLQGRKVEGIQFIVALEQAPL